jgi:predicted heme/steroid binding protein/uncharacterized membrane protein
MKAKISWGVFVFFFMIFLFSSWGNSTEEYAEKTGKSCAHCHLDSSGGGELTKAGEDYLEHLLSEDEAGQSKVELTSKSSASKLIRLFVGFIHIITGIFWFGTILYVHLILKPAYAAHGLPKGELKLGLISMAIMGITGTILTLFRIPSLSVLFETRFGILLIIKIAIFLIMVSSALYVVIFLGPELKKSSQAKPKKQKGEIALADLGYFDGVEERSAYIAYNEKIYDMTESDLWKNGLHFERHKAGEDLTDMLKQAPHGEDKIFEMPQVGRLITTDQHKIQPASEKVFYFLAYFNLGAVFLITLILALWQWW